MRWALGALTLLVGSVAVPAQTGSRDQPAGLEANWDIAPVLRDISTYAARLAPLLDKFDPKVWIQKGASETYAEQLQSSKDQAKALSSEAGALASNPERLAATLEIVFR